MKNKFFMMAVVATLMLLTSCAKVPQVEIDKAKAATQEAKNAGAVIYQPLLLAAVEDSLRGIMEQVEVQKSKMIPKYSDIKVKLGVVTNMAAEVKQNTEERKVEIRQDILATLDEVKLLLDENKNLLAKAPKGKEGVAAIEMIKTDILIIESSVAETGDLLKSEELIAAQDKIRLAKEKASSINLELKTVIQKATKRS